MGIYIDTENKFSVYDVPKGGGTTIRSWVNYAGSGNLNLKCEYSGDSEYLAPTTEHYSLLENEWECYVCDWFREVEGESIAVKRDPVERFLSCYEDKVLREGFSLNVEFDEFLDNFEEILKNDTRKHSSNKKLGYLWYHFAPQVYQLGRDINYYKKIFDTNEIGTSVKTYLEQKWNIKLPDSHCRKNTKRSIILTNEQEEKIKEIYKEDYLIGWC